MRPLHAKLTRASKFMLTHVFKGNGSTWKSHQRPRFPWYEMYWHPREVDKLNITMWRGYGGNSIEISRKELDRFIDMLQAARDHFDLRAEP